MNDHQTVVTAVAHPNIALAKYWGKCAFGHNFPAVPSLSITLAGMETRTQVSLGQGSLGQGSLGQGSPEKGEQDQLELDGEQTAGRPLKRISQLLDLLWKTAGKTAERPRAMVSSSNDFPTAAGLASSASAFAALAVAGNGALGTELTRAQLSCIARQVSASAGRSLFGGFVELLAGKPDDETLPARQVAGPDHWDLRLVVAVTAEGKKDVGSTEGMLSTAQTSPLYAAWVDGAPAIFDRIKSALLSQELAQLGPAVEQSALTMHATALAADPGLLYWNGGTMNVMRAVRQLRKEGMQAFFTIDAGPHVKVLCRSADAAALAVALEKVPGVLRTIAARPGEGAHIVTDGA